MALLLPYISALLALFIYLPCSASQTVVTVAPTALSETCQPITDEIPTCINVGWSNTSFPNLRSHQTQAEAYEELEDFDPLIRAKCSNKIVHFLCAIYAPVCLHIGSSPPEPIVLEPCRSLCEYVRSDCEPQLEAVGYNWPAHLSCHSFPSGFQCVDVDDDVEFPLIPGLTEDSQSATTPPVTSSTAAPISLTPFSPTSPSSSIPTPSPSLQPSPCEGFLDEGNCVESCNSQKYIVDNDGNIAPNPDYRVTFRDQCLKSCPEGYLEHMSQCITNCPPSFKRVNDTCEECTGDCDEDKPTQQIITIISVDQMETCEPITNVIPTCVNVGWTNASYPNLRSHQNQSEAYDELKDFDPLIQMKCSNKIVHFLCAIYAPLCVYPESSSHAIVVEPCRSLCEYVRSDCEPVLNKNGYDWPSDLRCDSFIDSSGCLDVSDSIEIPYVPGLTASPSTAVPPSLNPSPARVATSAPIPILSPSLQVQSCEKFADEEGNCFDSCNSQKYTVDNNQNVFLNPDYRVTFNNLCLRSCPEGYVEHMTECVTCCPQGFLAVDGVCEECIGDCAEELELTSGSGTSQAGLTVVALMLATTVELVTSFLACM